MQKGLKDKMISFECELHKNSNIFNNFQNTTIIHSTVTTQRSVAGDRISRLSETFRPVLLLHIGGRTNCTYIVCGVH